MSTAPRVECRRCAPQHPARKKMYDWAIDPALGAMEAQYVRLISDADGAVVTVEQIKTAVREVIAGGVDQLILYFSGHGMIINNLETWLLSDAPDDGDAAISVTRSAQAARFGVTPHVVIVSDACRTPAQELQTQSVNGASAFPNNPTEAPEKRVDVFYATAPGRAALELNTTDSQGIYTEVLHGALTGTAPDVLEAGESGDAARYIWSGPLGEYLETAVAERLIALQYRQRSNAEVRCAVRQEEPPVAGACARRDASRRVCLGRRWTGSTGHRIHPNRGVVGASRRLIRPSPSTRWQKAS